MDNESSPNSSLVPPQERHDEPPTLPDLGQRRGSDGLDDNSKLLDTNEKETQAKDSTTTMDIVGGQIIDGVQPQESQDETPTIPELGQIRFTGEVEEETRQKDAINTLDVLGSKIPDGVQSQERQDEPATLPELGQRRLSGDFDDISKILDTDEEDPKKKGIFSPDATNTMDIVESQITDGVQPQERHDETPTLLELEQIRFADDFCDNSKQLDTNEEESQAMDATNTIDLVGSLITDGLQPHKRFSDDFDKLKLLDIDEEEPQNQGIPSLVHPLGN